MDKCCKLHGFLPGYRLNRSSTSTKAHSPASSSVGSKQNQSAFFASLNTDQYSSLMSMLQSHLQPSNTGNDSSEICHVAGIRLSNSNSSSSHESNVWVIDSGATSHI